MSGETASAPSGVQGISEGALLSAKEARQLVEEAISTSAAEHTEVLLETRREGLTRFANNQIHQNVTSLNHTLLIRARVGKRAGLAITNRIDSSALTQAADRALTLARLSPEDPHLPEPGGPEEYAAREAFAPATAASTPEERAAGAGPVMLAAARRGLNAAGALGTTAAAVAYANSRGRFASQTETYANFTCTVRSDSSSGWVDRHRRDANQLDTERLGALAIEKAERSKGSGAIEPGRYTVVLEPNAVAELVSFLAFLGLGGQSLDEGRSFMTGRVGERITGERITIADDAYDPRGFGRPFDYEGTPRQRVCLIENGVARAVVHDRRTGNKAGSKSTGHASPPPATEGPLPYSLVLAGGDQSLEEMIGSTERGILVTRFWYNRVVDAKKTLITGMTRDGTFLIEGGRLTRGLRNLRFNESVLEALSRAEAIGRDAEPTVFDWSGSCVVAPALKVREFRFTGVSPF